MGDGRGVTFSGKVSSNILTIVCPAKAGMFSGSQSHRGKSQHPVACVASVEETKRMKPTDQALCGRVSELPGRNTPAPRGGPDTISPGGRVFYGWVKAAGGVAG